MNIVEKKVEELISAEYNPRQISEKQLLDLKKSLDKFGLVEPIVVNVNPERYNIVVGGHQRLRVVKDLGFREVPCVEVNLTVERERELNIRLNKNTGAWDWDILANLFEVDELVNWGFTDDELFGADDEPDDAETEGLDKYTKKIKSPVYELTGEQPLVSELYNDEKAQGFIAEIQESDVDEELKLFLMASAMRHVDFNFKKIGEFYANQDEQVQRLMEKQALVIIDFDKAMENGYVEMSKTMTEIIGEEDSSNDA